MNNELDLIFKSCSSRALLTNKSWWDISASFNFLCSRSTDSWICPTSSTILWYGGSRHSSTSGRWVRASSRVWATFKGASLSRMDFFNCWICFSCECSKKSIWKVDDFEFWCAARAMTFFSLYYYNYGFPAFLWLRNPKQSRKHESFFNNKKIEEDGRGPNFLSTLKIQKYLIIFGILLLPSVLD